MRVSEVSLGTVELGMEYGLKAGGEPGVPAESDARILLNRAIDSGVNFILVTKSGTAMKHSWITRSASFAYFTNHLFGYVSELNTNFRSFQWRTKLTEPSIPWMAGKERIVTPFFS